MIIKINNKETKTAEEIRSIFQVSYAVEAEILKAVNFPPLKRSLENYLQSNTAFYGYLENGKLTAVIEIDVDNNFVLIRSLVVHPYFFRQGIASKLLTFVFTTYKSNLFVVETGLENGPAKKLYKKFDFIEVHQWDTEFGIRKIKFEKLVKKLI